MSTMTHMQSHRPLLMRPTIWGLGLICLGTVIGTGMTMISPQFTAAANIGLVALGALIILDDTGEDHQAP